ncbi:hypothetical protein DIPPA_26122 [Diplonema papillatum]|nr:hypothetical protein DIPPA_26122 [Diplonema papillatum]
MSSAPGASRTARRPAAPLLRGVLLLAWAGAAHGGVASADGTGWVEAGDTRCGEPEAAAVEVLAVVVAGAATADACREACEEEAGCISFNFNPGTGACELAPSPCLPAPSEQGWVWYRKEAAGPPSLPDITIFVLICITVLAVCATLATSVILAQFCPRRKYIHFPAWLFGIRQRRASVVEIKPFELRHAGSLRTEDFLRKDSKDGMRSDDGGTVLDAETVEMEMINSTCISPRTPPPAEFGESQRDLLGSGSSSSVS